MTVPTEGSRPTKFYEVAPASLAKLRDGENFDEFLAHLSASPSEFEGKASYLAFVLGYLEDEHLLEPVDEPLTRKLGQSATEDGIFSLYAPSQADLSRITPSNFNGEELTHEYFAAPNRDPEVAAKLLAAVSVIRQNLDATPRGALLLIQV